MEINYIVDQIIKQSQERDEKYKGQLHLSQLFICGYRYSHDGNGTNYTYPSLYKMTVGTQMHKYIQYIARNKGLIPEFQFTLYLKGLQFFGNVDLYDPENNEFIEIKTSNFKNGNTYHDIYYRQLSGYIWAYAQKRKTVNKGKLWIFTDKDFKEYKYSLLDEDVTTIQKNISAYENKKFIKGIENSLCSFCSVVDCPAKQLKKD